MSQDKLDRVFQHSKLRGTNRVVLLAIAWASHAPRRGESHVAELSLAELAHICRCTQRNIQHALAACEAAGELQVIRPVQPNQGAGARNRYYITLPEPVCNPDYDLATLSALRTGFITLAPRRMAQDE